MENKCIWLIFIPKFYCHKKAVRESSCVNDAETDSTVILGQPNTKYTHFCFDKIDAFQQFI